MNLVMDNRRLTWCIPFVKEPGRWILLIIILIPLIALALLISFWRKEQESLRLKESDGLIFCAMRKEITTSDWDCCLPWWPILFHQTGNNQLSQSSGTRMLIICQFIITNCRQINY